MEKKWTGENFELIWEFTSIQPSTGEGESPFLGDGHLGDVHLLPWLSYEKNEWWGAGESEREKEDWATRMFRAQVFWQRDLSCPESWLLSSPWRPLGGPVLEEGPLATARTCPAPRECHPRLMLQLFPALLPFYPFESVKPIANNGQLKSHSRSSNTCSHKLERRKYTLLVIFGHVNCLHALEKRLLFKKYKCTTAAGEPIGWRHISSSDCPACRRVRSHEYISCCIRRWKQKRQILARIWLRCPECTPRIRCPEINSLFSHSRKVSFQNSILQREKLEQQSSVSPQKVTNSQPS